MFSWSCAYVQGFLSRRLSPSREFNWVIAHSSTDDAVAQLHRLLASWDQLAYWAITVGSNIASAVPIMGNKIRFLMLGGNAVNGQRIAALLCVALHDPAPRCMFFVESLLAHSQDGGLYSQTPANRPPCAPMLPHRHAKERNNHGRLQRFHSGVKSNAKKFPPNCFHHTPHSAQVKAETEDQIQTFPEVLFRAAIAIQVLARCARMIALVFKRAAGRAGRSFAHSEPPKAPWYFLGLQEIAALLSAVVAGVLVPDW